MASRRLGWLTALVPLTVVVVAGWALRWTDDSAFVGFRVVDQIAHGHGPVFNVGERVEAFSSPLWLAILWLGNGVLGLGIEWFSVVVGLLLSVGGLGAACAASLLLCNRAGDRDRPGHTMLPLGALVFALLPGVWPFFTSGLDTGLSFAWLGASFLCLVLVHRGERSGAAMSRRRLLLVAVLVGIGPLVQVDFVVFSIAFVVALVAVVPRDRAPRPLALAAAAFALPLAYELYRMGYYAALIPNADVAREPGGAYPSQGVRYLWDLVGTYWLFVPLAALLALALLERQRGGAPSRGGRVLVAAPVVAGVAHALFVVKVGGDYMHARLLLPALFAILSPVAMVSVPKRRAGMALAAVTCVWAVVCALALRDPYGAAGTGSNGIVDERAAAVHSGGASHDPVTAAEHGAAAQQGAAVARRAAAGERVITFAGPNSGDPVADTPARAGLPVPVVAAVEAAGVFGYSAGVDAWVVDRRGLADPLAARIDLPARGLPGQEKLLEPQWVIARFGDSTRTGGDAFVEAARQAMGCSRWAWDGTGVHRQAPLRQTLSAISEPLTAGRFLSNIGRAATERKVRFAPDPPLAAMQICGPY
jgi:arabinofuranosyltransferase